MAWSKQVTLWCDRHGCKNWVTTNCHSTASARECVRLAGWWHDYLNNDVCPECLGHEVELTGFGVRAVGSSYRIGPVKERDIDSGLIIASAEHSGDADIIPFRGSK